MRKIIASLIVGVLLSVPATARRAGCASIITVGSGESKQVCFLSDSYVINGVQFCEYNC